MLSFVKVDVMIRPSSLSGNSSRWRSKDLAQRKWEISWKFSSSTKTTSSLDSWTLSILNMAVNASKSLRATKFKAENWHRLSSAERRPMTQSKPFKSPSSRLGAATEATPPPLPTEARYSKRWEIGGKSNRTARRISQRLQKRTSWISRRLWPKRRRGMRRSCRG